MGLTTTSGTGWKPYDADVNNVSIRDMSQYFLAALRQEHQFLSMVGTGEASGNTKIEWMEQTLNPGYITGAEALDDSETGLDITDAQANLVWKGCLLRDTASGKTEVVQVEAVGASGSGGLGAGYTLLTIARGYQSGSGGYAAEAHDDGATYRIMPADQMGSGPHSDQTRARTTRYNYMNEISADVIVAAETLASDYYNVADELRDSIMARTTEARDKLADIVLNGVRLTSSAPSDTAFGTMGGIINFIKNTANGATWGTPVAAANSNYDTTAEVLTYNVISDMLGAIYDNGVSGGKYFALMPRNLYEVLGGFTEGEVRRQYAPSGQTVGSFVDTVISRQGTPVKVFIESYVPDGCLLIAEASRLKLRPMKDNYWKTFFDPIGTNRNNYAAMRLLGQFSLEIHNPDKAFALHTGLTAA